MSRCLQLAKLGAGRVAPNPMVGAVLVHEDKIIGEGYHQQYGGPHAEVNCINSVLPQHKAFISTSTLYVSLEPCAHFGKTPPCADLIIQHAIPKVVIACRDLFAKVNGLGIQKLQDAGIDVVEGIMEQEAMDLNKRFFCFHQQQRPYIILKWAQTADGFIAENDFGALAISNSLTNRWVHRLRAENAAIMIGTNTAIYDDPSLNTRHWPGQNPARIVIDKQLRIPASARLFENTAAVIVLNEVREEQQGHIYFHKTGTDQNLLPLLMQLLFEKNITSLLVEGGSTLLQSFTDADLWDEAYCITNTRLEIGTGIPAIHLGSDKRFNEFNILSDAITIYKNSLI